MAALLLLLAALLFALAYVRDTRAKSAPPPASVRHVNGDTSHKCSPGPWGDMICQPILIEPVAEIMPLDAALNTRTHWYFKADSPRDVAAILSNAGISDPLQAAVLGSLVQTDGGFTATPPSDLVIALSPPARAALYRELGRWPQNVQHAKPFRVVPNQLDEWLDDSALSPETMALVRKLLYPGGPFLLFADSALVIQTLPSPEDRKRFLQMVYRQRAVLPKLRIREDSDVTTLVRYWGAHGRESRILPLIESLKRSGGGEIDVALLLPSFARERLYSYQFDDDAIFRDCSWSAMNFFLTEPDARFADAQYLAQTVSRDYMPASGERLFGDIIVLRGATSGNPMHVCNYIADDIVFTKNGGSRFRPWVLMRLQDVVDYYSLNGPIELAAFRLKK